MTVFPSARIAQLGVRIGKMVKKYGVKKVAQVLTRTYKGSDTNLQKQAIELAKQASGVAALSACR